MRHWNRVLRFAILLPVVLVFSSVSHAQYRASLQGVVQDPSGAAVSGASVTLTNKDTNISQTDKSDKDGVYNFLALPPGHYSIAVSATGFKTKTLEDVVLYAEQPQALNIQLEIGPVSSAVTVNAEVAPPIDTETGQIGLSLTDQDIQQLPNLGRDPYKLLQLAPGIFGNESITGAGGGGATTPGYGGGPAPSGLTTSIYQVENAPQIQAGGQPVGSNNYQIDGVEVNSLDWNGAAIITPSEDSVQEIRVTSNVYDATLGRSSGAQVEVVSKSGTNNLHGSFFFKIDRPGLNAFQAYNGPAGSGADIRVSDRFNQFGFSAGGPVIHNHLFAFFAYETLRNNSLSPGNTWVETPQFLMATGTQTGFISAELANFPGENPSIVKVLPGTCATAGMGALPAQCENAGVGINVGSFLTNGRGNFDPTFGVPGVTPFGVGGGLPPAATAVPTFEFAQLSSPNDAIGDQYHGRVDYQATPSDLLTYSLYWTTDDSTFFNGADRASDLWHSDHVSYSQAAIWNHTFSPTLLNEARFNVSRWYFNELQTNPQEPFGLPLDFLNCVGGACDPEFGSQGPGVFYKTNYNIRDTATKSLGRHTLRFGTDIYFEQNRETDSGAGRPDYVFRNLWEFANDAPIQEFGVFNPTTGVPTFSVGYLNDRIYSVFLQDDFKVKPNLTLNMGLRWEYFTPVHDKTNAIGYPLLGADPNELANLSMGIGGNVWNANMHNFGPQFGFAWTPRFTGGKTVVRGGFGIGYDRTEDAIADNALLTNVPFNSFFNFEGATASDILYAVPSNTHQFNNWPMNPHAELTFNPVTHLPIAGEAPVSVFGIQRDLPTPRTYRWSFETQTEIGHGWVATVGYQGSKSSFYDRKTQADLEFTPRNPEVQQVLLWNDDAHSNYNALLTELNHRFSNTFSLDFQYVYSKSLDNSSNDQNVGDYEFFGGLDNYGPSDFDVTHNFKAWTEWNPRIFSADDNWMKKTLEGWKLSPIWNFHSGFPWSPVYNVQFSSLSNTCSLVYLGSNYCTIRPVAYLGGAGRKYDNATLESGPTPSDPTELNSNFPKGAPAYFTPPALTGTATSGIPPAGIGRNSFRGPRYNDVDFTIAKAFQLPNMKVIGEGGSIEIRSNFYNLLNSVNLSPLGDQTIGTLSVSGTGMETVSPNTQFGEAQSALAGRVLEFEARFSF